MGCAAQAIGCCKGVLRWLGTMFEGMDEEDRRAAMPIMGLARDFYLRLEAVGKEKIDRAVEMERIVTEEWKKARTARIRQEKAKAEESGKNPRFGMFSVPLPLSHAGKATPLAAFDREEMLKTLREAFPNVKNPPE
jgi:hypothetical protein